MRATPRARQDGRMVLNPDDLGDRARALARAGLDYWPTSDDVEAPAELVRDAILAVQDAPDDDALVRSLEGFVASCSDAIAAGQPWSDTPLGPLLRGLYSAARQYLRLPEAQEVLRLCNEVRAAVEETGRLESHPNELVAALMVVEDAANAIAGYAALPPFQHVDEAYLAKYGLLQSLQVGFDGAEAVARCLGSRIRADSVAGGKAVKIARNIVAGHPIGGTMAGESWHHFHDRGSAHEKAVIRVMSFSRSEPERWTGQTLPTDELVAGGLDVIAEVIRRALADYTNTGSQGVV